MYKISYRAIAITTVAMASFFMAAIQPLGYSPDYSQYEYFFQQLRLGLKFGETRFEPGFVLISAFFTNFIQSNVVVYAMLVLLSVSLKLHFCIRRTSIGVAATVAIFYFFKFLPLHELTQLRVAMAAALMVGAFHYASIGYRSKALAIFLVGFLFHYSALILAPFLFLLNLNRLKLFIFSIFTFVALSLTGSFINVTAGTIFQVFAMYENPTFGERPLNPFSPVFFPEFFLIICSLYMWRDLTMRMKQVIVFQIFGFAVFFAILEYNVIAVRGREFFSVMWLFYIADLKSARFRIKLITGLFVFSSIVLSIYLFFSGNFFTPASDWP